MSYSIIYYETVDGDCPVRKFIEEFDLIRERPAIYARLALLEEHGPQLKRPYVDFLRDKIYELRFKISKKQVRILYFFTRGNTIILTHGFVKKTTKVPENEIERAIRYRRDYLDRHGEKP
ncbi:MAG: type II toxin-antitoxin system RelE/ParE family toxin [bacterium]